MGQTADAPALLNCEPAIGAADVEAECTVTAPLVGAAERTVHGRRYIPRAASVRYTRRPNGTWRVGPPTLYGLQIRKDGTTGTREISEYFLRGKEVPPWLADFVDEHNPEHRSI